MTIPTAGKVGVKMTSKPDNPQRTECRLVLIERHSTRILATAGAASHLLPRESIPTYTRTAEFITKAIDRRYGLNTIQLALLPEADNSGSCAVHEIIGVRQALPGSLSFAALDEFASSELTDGERATVRRIMRGEASELGRFANLGWLDKLLVKIGSDLDQCVWPFIRHVNQGIDFCLLSITEATGRKTWFKAVGEPNRREYPLTVELTRRFPSYLPTILVTIPEWNGWVTEDVIGVPLNESDSICECEQALSALAVMQKAMASNAASLLALGAKNWTYARIASLLDPFFQEAHSAMQAWTAASSKPLTENELSQLRKDLESALKEFMNAGIPESLLHGDIGHGNVIATPDGPAFLDWAETYIGHPFMSAEHLLADLARSNPMFAKKQAALRSHYVSQWTAHAQPEDLEKVAALAPTVAAFVYAMTAWDASHDRPDPTKAWPLIRSMLRRTKTELDQVPECIA